MAKAIYSLKIFLFQDQFTLTTKEKHAVRELALFVSLVYVRFWHEAPLATKAHLICRSYAKCKQEKITNNAISPTISVRLMWLLVKLQYPVT